MPAFCSLVGQEEEKRGAKPSRSIVARRGLVIRAWKEDGKGTPGCICRMLFVDPQDAATLGNKGSHCLLQRVSQH